MVRYKRIVFESTRMLTERQFRADGAERVLAELTASDRKALSSVDVLGWYPAEPVLACRYAARSRARTRRSCPLRRGCALQRDVVDEHRAQGRRANRTRLRAPTSCARLAGWLQRAIEVTGGQIVVVVETAYKYKGKAAARSS